MIDELSGKRDMRVKEEMPVVNIHGGNNVIVIYANAPVAVWKCPPEAAAPDRSERESP